MCHGLGETGGRMATRDGAVLLQQQVGGACCPGLAVGISPKQVLQQTGHANEALWRFSAALVCAGCGPGWLGGWRGRAVRNTVFGGSGVLWGAGILLYSLVGGGPREGGAYSAGQVAGMAFGVLLLGVGLCYLITGIRSLSQAAPRRKPQKK